MIPVNELRNGTAFELDNEVWKVLEYRHVKVGRGNANIKVKVRNVLTNAITEKSFISGDKVKKANITNYPAQYLYRESDNYIFMDNNTYEQFPINKAMLGIGVNFLQDNMKVDIQFYNEKPIGVLLPASVILEVTQAEPAVKGNTSTQVTKSAVVSTGYTLQVPAFVNKGDKIKINTETGEYIERA